MEPPCSCPRDQVPPQGDLAQAIVELTGAALGKREHIARAAALRLTAADRAAMQDEVERVERVVQWLRAHQV